MRFLGIFLRKNEIKEAEMFLFEGLRLNMEKNNNNNFIISSQ